MTSYTAQHSFIAYLLALFVVVSSAAEDLALQPPPATLSDKEPVLMQPSVEKRSWNNLHSSWGKKSADDASQILNSYLQRGNEPRGGNIDENFLREVISSAKPSGYFEDEMDDRDTYLKQNEEKRGWKNMNAAWGKREGNPNWNRFRGSWGKREPGWNNLKGLWDKRASWNKLSSAWGKRSDEGMNGY